MIDLTGRNALVTGAGSGIGRAIARRLAKRGAVVAIADLNLEGGGETAALIHDAGGTAVPIEVDITDRAAVQELRDAVHGQLGPVGIVVNNVGWDLVQPFVETTPEFWDRVVAVNYLGPVHITHTFLPDMIESEDSGHIVNIASDAGRVGSLGETVYAGAKGGVIAFTKSLARETARYGINANCVCPGPTDTPLLYEQSEKVRAAMLRAIPFRRVAQPEEIANAVAFLASDEASYITGQVLSVSGGLTMAG